jgi:hypothetical protein
MSWHFLSYLFLIDDAILAPGSLVYYDMNITKLTINDRVIGLIISVDFKDKKAFVLWAYHV